MTGGRSFAFEVRDLGADSMTVTHPFRGTMTVAVDPEGHLLTLDAGATTRKLLVERKPWGSVDVPAGRYTLYTLPAPDGGILIVNRQTGQGGTTYNEDQDLGRTPMTRTEGQEPVEAFTIDVEETGPGTGVLRLKWDRDAFEVPITAATAG
jgi:hypothetical protein